jgi:chorismate mutase
MVREPEEPTQQESLEPTVTIETTTETTIDTEPRPDIDDLRHEIDRLDATILAAVKRRTEVSQEIGRARMASGGTRLVHSREMKVIERYSELGPEGKDLAMLLLRLGRGRLGR